MAKPRSAELSTRARFANPTPFTCSGSLLTAATVPRLPSDAAEAYAPSMYGGWHESVIYCLREFFLESAKREPDRAKP
jgi:hypothetical protein